MGDQFDYLLWRGDLGFSADSFNEVDGSILSMLSYIDFDAISGGNDILLRDAAEGYCPEEKYDSVRLGLIIPSKKINRAFCKAAATRRFGSCRVSDYEWHTNMQENCQFAAMVFHMSDGRAVISYRGTDDSLAGWREDCCLSYLDEIPAQRRAVEYFERMAAKYPDERFYLVGHSKGGNLAAYATVCCDEALRGRIIKTYSFDGPGLNSALAQSKRYTDVQRKIVHIVPQSSFIGTMFDVRGRYTVVNGTVRGAYQHDSFTWEVEGARFARLPELSARGKKNLEQFNQSMERMTLDEKKEFVETMFSVIESTGAQSLTDFTSGTLKKMVALIKNYGGMDKEKRALMVSLVLKLFDFKRTEAK